MGHWLKVAKNGKHPFVAQAGKLAVEALKTGQPERFLWIDESGIVSSVGSRAAQACEERKHHLWIPPSAGWAYRARRAATECTTSVYCWRSSSASANTYGSSRSPQNSLSVQ